MDARIRYTKMRVREAIFQLLSTKKMKEISVKEVCELAEINRATFYKHYMDIYDLVDKQECELMDSIFEAASTSEDSEQLADSAELTNENKTSIVQYLDNIAINQGAIHILGGPNGDELFCKKIAERLIERDYSNKQMLITDKSDTTASLMKHIFYASAGEIILHWIQNGAIEKTDLVAKQIQSFGELLMAQFAPEQPKEQETIWVPLQPVNGETEAVQSEVRNGNNIMGWLKRALFVE